MNRRFPTLALLLAAALAAAGEFTVDFSKEDIANWKTTKGVTAAIDSGALVLDGTGWDSKVYRTIQLEPGQLFELSAEAKDRTVIKVLASWDNTLAALPVSGGTFRTGRMKFRTPDGNGRLILCIQVNAEKGRAEVKKITLAPAVADAPEEKKLPPDSLFGVVLEEKFATPEAAAKVSGAEFVPGGGPDGMNCIRLADDTAEMELDAGLLRGRLVTVEALVKGEKLGGGTLQIVPAYVQGPGEFYPSAHADKGDFDWKKFGYSIRIPDYAGNLKLRFGHAGRGGTACYADVKLSLAPLPAPCMTPDTAPLQKTPKYRGAMIGSLSGDEENSIRDFAEVWHGNIVRYQFGGGGNENTPEEYRKWGEAQMAALDRKLEFFHKYGVKVVIDLHSGPSTMNELLQNVGVWSVESQDMIVDLWREIARRYKGNPDIYGYDILNEPLEPAYVYQEGGALDWNRLAERIGKAIREIDPDTPIIVAPAVGGNPVGFASLRPIDVSNTIYTVHFYLPHGYTHQGVNGMKMIGAYPGVNADGRTWDKALLRKALEPVVEFQKRYRVPILVGEFGAARWAPGSDRYLTDSIDLFEEYGWDWCYHAYREWPGWSAEHSTDPADMARHQTTPRKEMLIRRMQLNRAE